MTYSVPSLASSGPKTVGSIGGSKVTRTLDSVWRRTGGMEVKEAGVEAVNVRCSSGEMYDGISVTRVTAGMVLSFC